MIFTLEPGRYARTLFALLTLSAIVLLQGCFHDDDPGPTPDADPTGYYSQGTLSVNDGNTTDNALLAIIHNKRMFLLSVTTGLLYEGTITITGNRFTSTAIIYKDGINAGSTDISGMITPSSQITGELSGNGVASGTFSALYAQSNIETASVSNIVKIWASHIGGSSGAVDFEIDIAGNGTVTDNDTTTNGSFESCNLIGGVITPISGTNLYTVNAPLSSCAGSLNNNGDYTGLATSEPPYTALVFIMTKGDYGLSGNFQ